ncbi:chorion peroxidase-like [Limulus polyphemus]|uniref:Chorion peroxidase-like n=1 Tax=Limulus polyphemus TaxID=6850 RepID=A0ABM1SBJ3_LIMPO|nr:chorion peroxidase-like [Limulus polyphemus]
MTFLPIVNISDLRHSPTRSRDYYVNPSLINEAAKAAYQRLAAENKNLSRMAKRDTFTTSYTSPDCPALKRHYQRMMANALVSSMDEKAALMEFTTYELAKRLGLTRKQAFDLAHVDLKGTNLQKIVDEATRQRVVFCESNSKFRTIDGTCNNLIKPRWGSSFNCFNRFLHPNYADGLSSPRRAFSGNELPNPRLISTTLHSDSSVLARDFTHLVMQWGQFLDHDITLTPFSSFPGEDLILGNPNRLLDCCALENQHNSQCFAFSIPQKDPFFSQFQQRCMNFRRSARCLHSQTAQREQINQLTSFVDGSQIYGSYLNDSLALRTLKHDLPLCYEFYFSSRSLKGLLRTQTDNQGKELLPVTPDTEKDLCSDKESNKICFRAGDERVNEQPGLTSMHTIWLRQHNALARQLRQLNPSWDDERLYQEARRILVAQLQMITYNEFLLVVLGPLYHRFFRLKPLRFTYTRYNPNNNPTVMNAFATAAYRFGHTLIQNRFNQVNSKGITSKMVLENNFFFPFGLYEGELDSTLKGLMTQNAQAFDTFISKGITNHLYRLRDEKFGLDLIAFNIQRGRDHGLRSYTDYVRFCFGLSMTRFSQLLWFMPSSARDKFQKLYENVQDIDLFSAGINERPLPGSVVGPTFGCIIGFQFALLKKGDRFYFEHKGQAGSFTRAQLREIRKTSLARILCDNSDGFRSVMRLPFRTVSFMGNRVVQCRDLPQLNLEPWRS